MTDHALRPGHATMGTETPRWQLWTGRVLSAAPVLMMLMSAAMKLSHTPQVVAGFAKFGYPEHLLTPLALIELSCIVLYLLPRSAVLGAILVAGYLGGAVATHVRVGGDFLAPLVLGVLAWAGLWLRHPRLQALLPLRKSA